MHQVTHRHTAVDLTESALATTTSSWTHERCGGFLLTRQEPHWIHARLTGRLSTRTLRELDLRVLRGLTSRRTHFLVLDATQLQHIPLDVAHDLAGYEQRWRQRGVVAVWVALSPYLSNLLVLACGHEHRIPALSDLETARAAVSRVAECPPSVARGRLEAHSDLVH
jgi:anti-anti-sigma regulatory factor